MATKTIEINLIDEVLAVLDASKGSSDFLDFLGSQVQEMLRNKKIEFEDRELANVLNALTRRKKIEFHHMEVNEKDKLDAAFGYPPRVTQ